MGAGRPIFGGSMRVFALAGVLGLVMGTVAWAQGLPKSAEAKLASPAPGKAAGAGGPYRSAFEGYRPFNAAEPLKDWRKANDEVRDAGGHVGLMKSGEPAQLKGHGAHGAKQATPPATEKK